MSKNIASVLGLIAVTGLLAVGLAAYTAPPPSPEDRARDIAERWVSASKAGSDDAAYSLTCPGAPLGGVNSDTSGFERYKLDVQYVSDGDFDIQVTRFYPDNPDSIANLRVQTEGDPCIKWVR